MPTAEKQRICPGLPAGRHGGCRDLRRREANYEIIWVFPTIEVPQNGWSVMENPIKTDDLGENPLFSGNISISLPLVLSKQKG